MKFTGFVCRDSRFKARELRRDSPGRVASVEGYTLVEVVVAVALIGIMVVSLYAGFSSGFAVLRVSREKSRATQVLLQRIEGARFCTWSQLASFPTTFQEPYDQRAGNGTPAFYYGTITLGAPSMIPDSADYKTNMQQVTVTVRWTNFNGTLATGFSESMTTLVARYGAQNFALSKGRQE
jgi:prepilin-type N-terminal cleavage/methylation domain-containing protein